MRLFNLAMTALLASARATPSKSNPAMEFSFNDTGLIGQQQDHGKIAPKVVIISMFDPEADVWYENLPNTPLGDILANNISIPGLSPLYPYAHCTKNGDVCQITAGEAEINAATTTMAFVLSDQFDLRKSYFLLAGIAGISPKMGTLGSVALSRFSVQVALQYEIDAREMPANFSTGYLPYGAYMPYDYPSIFYGTEVMEVNENLRDAAAELAARAQLVTSTDAADYCEYYREGGETYAPATAGPGVIKCDSATSDVYFSGVLLSEAFENTTKSWTNQNSAVLQSLMRAAVSGLVDFSRTILMRTGSDFDRPPPSISAFQHLRLLDQNGFEISIQNLYLAGFEIVQGIIADWDPTYNDGVKPTNYLGDILGTLGGQPDFGPGSVFDGVGASSAFDMATNPIKRSLKIRRQGRRAGGWK
ncbi:putative purine nucleoside permease [Hypomontagnella monticulosa]|nr:putative purine nucleoside permease [Hypomontagnella monticulosa]